MFRTLKPILISSCSFLFLISQGQAQNPFESCETLSDVETVYKEHLVPLGLKVKKLDQTSNEDSEARERIQTELAKAIEERNEASKYFVQALQKANGLMEDGRGVSVRIKRSEVDRKLKYFSTQAGILREEASSGARRPGILSPDEVQRKLSEAVINEEISEFWGRVSQNLKEEAPFKDHLNLEEKFMAVRSWRPQTVSLTCVTWQPFYIARDPWELEGFVLPREKEVFEKLQRPARGIIRNILLKASLSSPDTTVAKPSPDEYKPLDVTERIIAAYGASNIIQKKPVGEAEKTSAQEAPQTPVDSSGVGEREGVSPRGLPQVGTEVQAASAPEDRREASPPVSSGIGLAALVSDAPTEGTVQPAVGDKAPTSAQTGKGRKGKR